MDNATPIFQPLAGPAYRLFIQKVAELKKARNYLEIGVHNGSTLALMGCPAIGVDPKFVLDRNPIGSKPVLHLYQMTSDDFFRAHDPRRIFGSEVDLAFLDGLHLFEYLLRDFINTEGACAPDSLIMLDDCLPRAVEMTERDHRPALRRHEAYKNWWTGDVWKVIEVLREFRPDLMLTPVDVIPTGSVVVSNLDPSSKVLQDNYNNIVQRYLSLELIDESFESYWTVNAPMSVNEALRVLKSFWR